MTATLTTTSTGIPVLLEWLTGPNRSFALDDPATANVVPLHLGGMWKGHTITASDIQQARKELWSRLESAE